MIKLIISDFDGVLLDLKQLHFDVLNLALKTIDEKYVISIEDHLKIFDGLTTTKKLEILCKTKNFPIAKAHEINNLKQKFTIELLEKFSNINKNIPNVIKLLKNDGYLFYVASNAIKNTIEFGINKLSITNLVDKVFSNQDIKNPKPNSEIYLRCMVDAGVNPDETLIIEDSKYGREAALKSGAHVCGVDNSFDFSYNKIKNMINSIKPTTIKWAGQSDLNILIPMAGAGSRFAKFGYKLPKPLIDVNGIPMIQSVINNLNVSGNFIFIVQRDHYEKFNLKFYLNALTPNCKIILTDGPTHGAAWDTLLAKEFINNDKHLLIANSDQYIDNFNSCDFIYNAIYKNADASILTFESENDPKWSYVKLKDNYVIEVAEKKTISNIATIGIYYWKHGSDYIASAEKMIAANDRTNNEFYVVPAFNYAIKNGKKIIIYDINANDFWSLGTPEDLDKYLKR